MNNLTTAETLRLRTAFARWQRNPSFYAKEFHAAEQAVADSEKFGWKLSIDRFGVPTSTPPKNMALSTRELSRFSERLDSMSEEELTSSRAALVAISTRGFTARVDAKGNLIAVPPPKRVERTDVSPEQKAAAHKKFWSRRGGSYAFKSLPSKLV